MKLKMALTVSVIMVLLTGQAWSQEGDDGGQSVSVTGEAPGFGGFGGGDGSSGNGATGSSGNASVSMSQTAQTVTITGTVSNSAPPPGAPASQTVTITGVKGSVTFSVDPNIVAEIIDYHSKEFDKQLVLMIPYIQAQQDFFSTSNPFAMALALVKSWFSYPQAAQAAAKAIMTLDLMMEELAEQGLPLNDPTFQSYVNEQASKIGYVAVKFIQSGPRTIASISLNNSNPVQVTFPTRVKHFNVPYPAYSPSLYKTEVNQVTQTMGISRIVQATSVLPRCGSTYFYLSSQNQEISERSLCPTGTPIDSYSDGYYRLHWKCATQGQTLNVRSCSAGVNVWEHPGGH